MSEDGPRRVPMRMGDNFILDSEFNGIKDRLKLVFKLRMRWKLMHLPSPTHSLVRIMLLKRAQLP